MRQRIYVDNSVIGGCYDKEFAEDSKAFFKRITAGEFVAVISDITLRELQGAPPEVQGIIKQLPAEAVEIVEENDESVRLAELYLQAGVVSRNYSTDAAHIALAGAQRVDVLVSWNFKHIVNLERIRAYNSVNIREGYPPLEIRSPKEVLHASD
ncbi:MAG: PIN domain protein [Elusimicrobia bacterium]|nr:PIN domain protein [Elusimicrobiota bacterium]